MSRERDFRSVFVEQRCNGCTESVHSAWRGSRHAPFLSFPRQLPSSPHTSTHPRTPCHPFPPLALFATGGRFMLIRLLLASTRLTSIRAPSLSTTTRSLASHSHTVRPPARPDWSSSHVKNPIRMASTDGGGSTDGVVPPQSETVPSILNDAKPTETASGSTSEIPATANGSGGDPAKNEAREAKKREKELRKQEAAAKAAQKKKDAASATAVSANGGDASGASSAKKDKKEKAKEATAASEEPFVNTTPEGEKKGM